jgi:two-component system, cell cycle response regulator
MSNPYRVGWRAPVWAGDDTHCVVVSPPLRKAPAKYDALVVIEDSDPGLVGRRFLLHLDESPIRVGRAPHNHIVLDRPSVSRRHAHLERRGEGWILADDGSTHGISCNEERISGEVALKSGDRLKIGPTIFKLLSGGDVEAQATSASMDDAAPASRTPNASRRAR